MDKHYISPSHDIEENKIRKLPDRSALAKLYPGVKKTTRNEVAIIIDSQQIGRLSLFVGVSTPLPLLLGEILIELAMKSIDPDAFLFYLPGIVIGILLWALLSFVLYSKIVQQFDQLALNPISFFSLYLTNLILVTPLFFDSVQSNDAPLRQILLTTYIIAASLVVTIILLYSMTNEKIMQKNRFFGVKILLLICFSAATFYLFRHFH